MARASQIQMMAKQMGGRKKAEEAFRAYMKQMEKAQKKEGKAGRWGDIGGIGMSLLAAGLGAGTGPMGMLAMGALKGGMGGIGKELGYHFGGGGRGMGGPDLSKFSSSPYGRAYAKELFQKAGDERSRFQESLVKPGEFAGKGALAGLFSAAPGAIAEAGLFGGALPEMGTEFSDKYAEELDIMKLLKSFGGDEAGSDYYSSQILEEGFAPTFGKGYGG